MNDNDSTGTTAGDPAGSTLPAGSDASESAAVELAREVRRRRNEASVSIARLAAQIGYTPSHVSMPERPSKGFPSAELIKAIDGALEAEGALIALHEKARAERLARRRAATGTTTPAEPSETVPSANRELATEICRRRELAQLSQTQLASRTGYSRQVHHRVEKPSGSIPSEELVTTIDDALAAGGQLLAFRERAVADRLARRRHVRSSAEPDLSTQAAVAPNSMSGMPDIESLLIEVSGSSRHDDAIDQLGLACHRLAEMHTQSPAKILLAEVGKVHDRARYLLSRTQRLSNARELYRIDSLLLSHTCLLLGDLKLNDRARKHGELALALASEAGSNIAIPCTALAKTLRWEGRISESATMARRGFDASEASPVRIQLASQEANAAALLGNEILALESLDRAKAAAEQSCADSGQSAWSFSAGRQAIFQLSVAIKSNRYRDALRAAALADASWAAGEPCALANWAQIRAGAAIAQLELGSAEEAVRDVSPALELRPDLKVATVTVYMEDLHQRLSQLRYRQTGFATELMENIREFNNTALATSDRG